MKSVNQPSRSNQKYVRNRQGERVLNLAYKGKDTVKKSQVPGSGPTEVSDVKKNGVRVVTYSNGHTMREFSKDTGFRKDADGLWHGRNEPATWSEHSVEFFNRNVKHSTGAPNVINGDGTPIVVWYRDGNVVDQDRVIDETSLEDLTATAKSTAELSDRNPSMETFAVARRAALVSVVAKATGQSVEETAANQGDILTKLGEKSKDHSRLVDQVLKEVG